MEPKSELDSGMMPPPSGLLTVRRASSNTILSDQLGCSLKSELLDDSSQTSLIIDAVGSDSMDGRYSGSNENSVDATTMKEILFGPLKIRKSSLEIIDEDSNMSMVMTERSINVSPINDFSDSRMNSIHKEMEMNVEQKQHFVQMQGFSNNAQTTILPTLSQLESSVNKLTNMPNDDVEVMFVGQPNTTNVFHQQMITAAVSNQSTFLESLCTEAAANQLEQILDSNKLDVITVSPNNSILSNPIHSPIDQDIILNSQSMIVNRTGSPNNNTNSISSVLSVATSNSSQSSQHSMSPDIILNPSVSPTVMCQASGDPSNILNQQVTLANSMLNGISLSTQDAILNNLNLIPSDMNQQTDPIPIQTKTSIAVKNMYLKAANEILTTQPTESTINALISMDQSMMNVSGHQQGNTQVTSMLLSQPTPSTSVQNPLQNITMYTDTTNQMIQQQQQNLAQSQNVMSLLNEEFLREATSTSATLS